LSVRARARVKPANKLLRRETSHHAQSVASTPTATATVHVQLVLSTRQPMPTGDKHFVSADLALPTLPTRLQTQQYPLCNVRILTSVRATIIAMRKPLARITLGCTRVAVIQAGGATASLATISTSVQITCRIVKRDLQPRHVQIQWAVLRALVPLVPLTGQLAILRGHPVHIVYLPALPLEIWRMPQERLLCR